MELKRQINATTHAALVAGNFNPIFMVHIDWNGTPVYAHNGIGNISYDSHTWEGVGNLGEINVPGESSGLGSQQAVVSVFDDNTTLTAYLDNEVRGRQCDIYFACVTQPRGNVIVGAPLSVFSGFVDGLIEDIQLIDQADASVNIIRKLSVEVAQGPSQRKRHGAYHTDSDQRAKYPNDTAGRHVFDAERKSRQVRITTWPSN